MILLFHGMQSSLSMVYDREMRVMRLLLTAPLPRWLLLACKLVAGTALAVVTCYVFLAVCIALHVTFACARLVLCAAGSHHFRSDAGRRHPARADE
jgi:ABC-type Na+ efflux pump permease subunit